MIEGREPPEIPKSEEETLQAADRFFREAWHRCSIEGWCDAAMSAEYRRIRQEWIKANLPFDVWTFIRTNANKPPR